jgi:hypothetical protein
VFIGSKSRRPRRDGWASPGNRANANGPDSTAADPSANFFLWAFGAYYLVLDRLVQWV